MHYGKFQKTRKREKQNEGHLFNPERNRRSQEINRRIEPNQDIQIRR